MTDRRDVNRERRTQEEEDKRRVATERRGEQLREAWRKRHPEVERDPPRREKP